MARLPRLSVAGYPHHLIQRGNNRQAIFTSDADRRTLLGMLADYAVEFKVAIHAYVLMDNHFHLLATPASDDAVPRLMQAVGRRYVRYFNDGHERSGTLWEGRYRSSRGADGRLPADLHGVHRLESGKRAGMVARPAGLSLVQPRPLCIGCANRPSAHAPRPCTGSLGNTPFAREAGYAEIVACRGRHTAHQQALTNSAFQWMGAGGRQFCGELQQRTTRRVAKRSGQSTCLATALKAV
jgi:putative transposase